MPLQSHWWGCGHLNGCDGRACVVVGSTCCKSCNETNTLMDPYIGLSSAVAGIVVVALVFDSDRERVSYRLH